MDGTPKLSLFTCKDSLGVIQQKRLDLFIIIKYVHLCGGRGLEGVWVGQTDICLQPCTRSKILYHWIINHVAKIPVRAIFTHLIQTDLQLFLQSHLLFLLVRTNIDFTLYSKKQNLCMMHGYLSWWGGGVDEWLVEGEGVRLNPPLPETTDHPCILTSVLFISLSNCRVEWKYVGHSPPKTLWCLMLLQPTDWTCLLRKPLSTSLPCLSLPLMQPRLRLWCTVNGTIYPLTTVSAIPYTNPICERCSPMIIQELTSKTVFWLNIQPETRFYKFFCTATSVV